MKKTKLITNVKKVTKKIGSVSVTTGQVAVALVAALATAEIGFLGAGMLENDIEFTKDVVKHKVSPEPVLVKKNLFKKEVVTINPINGKIEPYKGSKTPVNKKPIKIKNI